MAFARASLQGLCCKEAPQVEQARDHDDQVRASLRLLVARREMPGILSRAVRKRVLRRRVTSALVPVRPEVPSALRSLRQELGAFVRNLQPPSILEPSSGFWSLARNVAILSQIFRASVAFSDAFSETRSLSQRDEHPLFRRLAPLEAPVSRVTDPDPSSAGSILAFRLSTRSTSSPRLPSLK